MRKGRMGRKRRELESILGEYTGERILGVSVVFRGL